MGKQALQCDRNLLADTGYRKEFSVKKKLKKRPFHYYTEYYLSTPYAMKQSSELQSGSTQDNSFIRRSRDRNCYLNQKAYYLDNSNSCTHPVGKERDYQKAKPVQRDKVQLHKEEEPVARGGYEIVASDCFGKLTEGSRIKPLVNTDNFNRKVSEWNKWNEYKGQLVGEFSKCENCSKQQLSSQLN